MTAMPGPLPRKYSRDFPRRKLPVEDSIAYDDVSLRRGAKPPAKPV